MAGTTRLELELCRDIIGNVIVYRDVYRPAPVRFHKPTYQD